MSITGFDCQECGQPIDGAEGVAVDINGGHWHAGCRSTYLRREGGGTPVAHRPPGPQDSLATRTPVAAPEEAPPPPPSGRVLQPGDDLDDPDPTETVEVQPPPPPEPPKPRKAQATRKG